MFYLPLYHNLQNANCLVVGAGSTAVRKIRWLIRAQANIVVVAPVVSDAIRQLADEGKLSITQENFAPHHITSDLTLVVSATNDRSVNSEVFARAQQQNVLVNCVDQPDLCTFIFPAIVDRSPILVAVSSMGAAPTLARVVRGWIETQLSPNLGNLAKLAQGLRDRVKQALPSIDERKAFWESLFVSHAAEQALQGKLDSAQASAEQLLASSDKLAGSIALVGAGPGDPELITLKALRLIQAADVVLYDKLSNPALLDYARRDAEFVYVGKQGPKPETPIPRPDNRSTQQHSINEQLVQLGKAGKNVVRLKGGDPFIYGRGGEELEAVVEAGLDVTVVPGITAALGAASYAGIPLTYRNLSQSVRFVTGHRVENIVNQDWPELGRPEQTLVIYMGLVGLAELLNKLMEHGCEPQRPAVLVEYATLPEQRIIDGNVENLAELAVAAEVKGPSVAIIGDVVALRAEF